MHTKVLQIRHDSNWRLRRLTVVVSILFVIVCCSPAVDAQNENAKRGEDLKKRNDDDAHVQPVVNARSRVGAPDGRRPNDPNEPHIWESDECRPEIVKYCKQLDGQSDMAILECLLDVGADSSATLSSACDALVWQYKLNLTRSDRFTEHAQEFCADELKRADVQEHCHLDQSKPGYLLACLLEVRQNFSDTSRCTRFLSRVAVLAFTDYRLIAPFLDTCAEAIEKHNCGSITSGVAVKALNNPLKGHSQGRTLECLIEKMLAAHVDKNSNLVEVVDAKCQKEVMRLSEMVVGYFLGVYKFLKCVQADDYHLDRPLYFACREDRERFCSQVQAGNGQVFQCLLMNKHDQRMKPKCVDLLNIREQLIGMNARVAHPLISACAPDIDRFGCGASSAARDDHFYLSFLILCLENAEHASGANSAKQQQPQSPPVKGGLAPQCRHEVQQFRQLLLSDYQLDAEVVLTCAQDIQQFCGGNLQKDMTMRCLMGVAAHGRNARPPQQLQPQCLQAVSNAVAIANPADDSPGGVHIDQVLFTACQQTISSKCSAPGNSQYELLKCLMENLEDTSMSDDCEDRLLEIQYFVARDWSMDPKLVLACDTDAKMLCGTQTKWWERDPKKQGPHPGHVVLSCLYRHAVEDPLQKLEQQAVNRPPGFAGPAKEMMGQTITQRCAIEMHRVMRERAGRVSLQPDIEENCRSLLAEHCSHDTRSGAELNCLMELLDKDKIHKEKDKDCYASVNQLLMAQSQDYRMNKALEKACRPIVAKHCSELMRSDIDNGEVMQCLLAHRKDAEVNGACLQYIDHYELISMRDYNFTPLFAKMCQGDVDKYCKDTPHEKAAIVSCLSSVRFKKQLLDSTDPLSTQCSQQLTKAFLDVQRVEANSNKELFRQCREDIRRLKCYGDGMSSEDVVECLRKNRENINDRSCKSMVFGVQEVEMMDNSLDATLMRACRDELQTLCAKAPAERKLKCLRKNKKSPDMSGMCLEVVLQRTREAANDIRLQPGLLQACREDIATNCPEENKRMRDFDTNTKELEGSVLSCLRRTVTDRTRRKMNKPDISQTCINEVHRVILESEYDPQLDVVFYRACKSSIEMLCSKTLIHGGDHQTVSECIKAAYYSHHITDKACKNEIARRTSEELSDIELDPLLNEACAGDRQRYCRDVPPGQGRIISCLISALESAHALITDECRAKLKDRERLWNVAHSEAQVALPENIGDIISLVYSSPASTSVFTYFAILVLVLFTIAFCFGRVTKRTRLEHKVR